MPHLLRTISFPKCPGDGSSVTQQLSAGTAGGVLINLTANVIPVTVDESGSPAFANVIFDVIDSAGKKPLGQITISQFGGFQFFHPRGNFLVDLLPYIEALDVTSRTADRIGFWQGNIIVRAITDPDKFVIINGQPVRIEHGLRIDAEVVEPS